MATASWIRSVLKVCSDYDINAIEYTEGDKHIAVQFRPASVSEPNLLWSSGDGSLSTEPHHPLDVLTDQEEHLARLLQGEKPIE